MSTKNRIEIKNNQLFINHQKQPQLYGAELQYFRLRAGYGRNIPREKVIDHWNKALDLMVEAKMNAISFYIPWDFHEYEEGKFDFTGTVDEDGDGNPDYPSRDLHTFIRLIMEHGITNIMVRPGPYINAEWGFLGFGAIPLWFHEKYPQSHMRNPTGLKTKMFDYHNKDFHKHIKKWFKKINTEILQKYMGKNKPIIFLQIDNETNFMWQSIYNHDYSAASKKRYRDFLKNNYESLDNLNQQHGQSWPNWKSVEPPIQIGINVEEDKQWYRFQDHSIHTYLKTLRTYWEELGVKEPNLIFTLAESYDFLANGLLPNLKLRNDPQIGMITMNLYPKTEETKSVPLLNKPFKSDHDVKAMDTFSDYYLGKKEEWLCGPEIQGGWWKGIQVSKESRKQTYLSVIGHGLKALFIYYFTEGYNWQSEWEYNQVYPHFEALKNKHDQLTESFWNELQTIVDQNVIVGIRVKKVMEQNTKEEEILFFDAPVDEHACPRKHFQLVKEIGEKLIDPHKDFLGKAIEANDDVGIFLDPDFNQPSSIPGLQSITMNSHWSAGLLGTLLQTGVNPHIVTRFHLSRKDILNYKIIMTQDSGSFTKEHAAKFKSFIKKGGVVINILGDSLAHFLDLNFDSQLITPHCPILTVADLKQTKLQISSSIPVYAYDLTSNKKLESNTQAILHVSDDQVVGYAVKFGDGFFIQIGTVFYHQLNSNDYAHLKDVPQIRSFMETLLSYSQVKPNIKILNGGDRVVAFGRFSPDEKKLMITVKNGKDEIINEKLVIDPAFLKKIFKRTTAFIATDVFREEKRKLKLTDLTSTGIEVILAAYESTVFIISKG